MFEQAAGSAPTGGPPVDAVPVADDVCRPAGLLDAARAALATLAGSADGYLETMGTHGLLAAVGELEPLSTLVSLVQARVTAALPVVEPVVRTVVDPQTGVRLPQPYLPAGAVSPQELSTVLGCSVETTRDRVATARVVADLPGVRAAAAAGLLRWWQVRRVADALADLEAPARAAVDARIAADAAAGRCRSRFAARLRRAVIAESPARAEEEHRDARDERRVTVRPADRGMAWFGALLPAEDALAVGSCLDALARTPMADAPTDPSDPTASGGTADCRTLDQRRADALVGLCREALERLHTGDLARGGTGAAPGPRRRSRRRGEVQLVVSAETVLGISDAPGDLLGYGPVDAGHARRIAHSAGIVWRRVLTDPVTGAVLDRGRRAYTPPAEVAGHVMARFGWQCSRPGCGHRAADLDHATAWKDGGATSAANLHPLCRGCHTARHTGWTVHLDEATGATWITPHGAAATTPVADLRPEDRLPRAPGHPTMPADPTPPGAPGHATVPIVPTVPTEPTEPTPRGAPDVPTSAGAREATASTGAAGPKMSLARRLPDDWLTTLRQVVTDRVSAAPVFDRFAGGASVEEIDSDPPPF